MRSPVLALTLAASIATIAWNGSVPRAADAASGATREPPATPAATETIIPYGDFVKVNRWSDIPLPQPHRLEPIARPKLPCLFPMRPHSCPADGAEWGAAKTYEAEVDFTVQNISRATQDVLFDILVYPTTPWQRAVIHSSRLPLIECFYDSDGNAWVRAVAGRMLPGERREQSLRMTVSVAKMALQHAEKREAPGAPDYSPAVARFLSDQSEGEARVNWSGTPELTEVARKITADRKGSFAKARAIYQWMRQNIRYGATGHGSGHSALVRRKAACGGQARLFVALCRSAGVPAREIDGHNAQHKDGSVSSHAWAEFYVPGFGWVPVDTTTSRFAYSTPWHVGKTTAFTRYQQLVCIPRSHQNDAYHQAGAIIVVTKDGAVAPEGEWGLASLRLDIREVQGTASRQRRPGVTLRFDDTALYVDAITREGSLLIPVRAFESLGAAVKWDRRGRIVTSLDSRSVAMTAGQAVVVVARNGQRKSARWPVAPRAINGITYVPLRVLAEAFGFAVEWKGNLVRLSR
ncbi:MAG: hypothetical protein JSV65_07970 [Armatimonadota bacterium]|nr:MAG: hypothetical protein JSV65_07970 [Armatimonadota bacterium]